MTQSILVPLDGSPYAEHILPHAAALAHATGCSLTIIQIITSQTTPPSSAWMAGAMPISESRYETDIHIALTYVATIASCLAQEGIKVQHGVFTGDAGECIATYAACEPSIAAIAMTTHGRDGLSRLIFGSVAEKVLHDATVPLLLVHPGEETPPAVHDLGGTSRIVVALDGSPTAEQALIDAQTIAQATGATLVLVAAVKSQGEDTSLDDPSIAEAGLVPFWMLADQASEVKHVSQYLIRTAEKLTAAGINVHTELAYGEPSEAILRVADEHKASLVVLASHGRSGFARLRLGSVAMSVVQQAELPVLLVRATQEAKHASTLTTPLAMRHLRPAPQAV